MTSNEWSEALVDAYLEYGRISEAGGDTSSTEWAYDAVTEIVEGASDDQAISLVLALIHSSPPALLAWVAAGPVEDLLCHRGPTAIGPLLKAAKHDAHARVALQGVWRRDIAPEVWKRLQDAIASWKG